MRFADNRDGNAVKNIEKYEVIFNKLGEKIDYHFKNSIMLTRSVTGSSKNTHVINEFKKFNESLNVTELMHKSLEKKILNIFEMVNADRIHTIDLKMKDIDREESEVSKSIVDLQTRIVYFTNESAIKAEADEEASMFLLIILAGIGIITSLIFGFSIASSLNRGIKGVVVQIHSLIASIIDGKLDTRGESRDVIIDFRNVIVQTNKLIDTFVEPLRMTSDYIRNISEGMLPEKITEEYSGDFKLIKNNINSMIDNLTSFAMNIQNASSTVATGSEQLSSSAEEMSQAAAEQASSVLEVASSMEEMNSSVMQNADYAKETATIAEKASVDAGKGGNPF